MPEIDAGGVSPAPPARAPRVAVIIPTLNEAQNVDPLLERVTAALAPLGDYEILVVDDASADGTPLRVQAWATRAPVRLIARAGPPDLAGAVRDGAQAAGAEFVVVMDADLSHPPEALPALLAPLLAGTHEVSVGSRYVRGGAMPGWPWHRRLMSRVAGAMAWPLTEVRDAMSGFFALRRDALLALTPGAAGYKILLELLCGAQELRVAEVPITFHDRTRGTSKLGLGTQLTYLRRLATLAGGRVSLGSATRFGGVGLLGMAVDTAVFQALLGLGGSLASAHMLSFLVATTSNFLLNRQFAFAGAGADRSAARYGRFVVVGLLALALRGGVLAICTQDLGLPPLLAIGPAVLATALVNYLGAAFYVFPPPKVSARVRWRVGALGLTAYLVALRLAYLTTTELILDETYYWNYAQHMALSFLDHPPLTAWLVAAGTALFGDGALGVRAGAALCGLLTLGYAYRYGAAVSDKTEGLICMMLAALLPAGFITGLVMTPDAPLLAASAGALYYLHRALVGGESRAWVGVGVACGLGLLAKYTLVLMAPAALLFMLLDVPSRAWLRRPQPYLAALLALALFTPVLVWNATHEWASFTFQTMRRFEDSTRAFPLWLPVQAAVMLGPVGLGAVLWGLWRLPADQSRTRSARFALVFAAVPLAVFTVSSFFVHAHLQWAAPAWLALLPLMASVLREPARTPRWLRSSWRPAIIATTLVFGFGLHYLALGLPGVARKDFGVGYLGWPQAAVVVEDLEAQVERDTGQKPIVVGLSKWSVASALRYYDLDRQPDNITSRQLMGGTGAMFELWFSDASGGNRPVIVVDYHPGDLNDGLVRYHLVGLGPIRQRPVYAQGTQVMTLYYRIARGYRPHQAAARAVAPVDHG